MDVEGHLSLDSKKLDLLVRRIDVDQSQYWVIIPIRVRIVALAQGLRNKHFLSLSYVQNKNFLEEFDSHQHCSQIDESRYGFEGDTEFQLYDGLFEFLPFHLHHDLSDLLLLVRYLF